ncbi:MAG: class I SAM-dependent rRNA methyltransferase [Deltaproteobacteria bacterium]|nr:class I SAM-dependent rRNA methyltransferase [Deltaproteobacteria bacterium]
MTIPSLTLSPKGCTRARAGHPWIFRSDILSAPPELTSGSEVRACDQRGNFVGRGFWAVKSPIALRILTRKDEPLDDALLRARLIAARDLRKALFPKVDAVRLVNGESDLMPGWFVDRYGDVACVQHLSEGMEARRETLARMLVEECGVRAVVFRDDGSSRDYEGLVRHKGLLHGELSGPVGYHEGEISLSVDLLADHKTGGYLDQRENHLLAGELARGECVDTFSYHGGFALQMARKADHVIAIDQDADAVRRTRENAEKNGLKNVEARAANAVEALRALDKEGKKFDMVVIDPPAFAKRKEGLEGALRAYKEVNYRGLRLLKPGGLLVTCSCSGKVTTALFAEVIEWAAQEAKRPVQLLERRGAGRDHAPLVGVPETEYLKTWFLRAP